MRSAVCVAVVLAAAACLASRGLAAPVDLQPSTQLNADVTADLTLGAASDSKSSHDTGSLSKVDVSAAAAAQIPVLNNSFTGNGGSASHLITSDDGFTLSSHAESTLAGTVLNSTGEVRSTTSIDLPFVLHDNFAARPSYQVDINAMVLKDQKVTIVLDRTDEQQSVFSSVFTASATGKLPELAAGSYRLQLITGSLSTAKGVNNEAGTATVQLSLSASSSGGGGGGGGTVIPIPAAAWTGGAILLALFAGHRYLRHIIA